MIDFLKEHFNVLLLSFFVLLFTGVVTVMVIKHVDREAIAWAAGGFSNFVGALLLLITKQQPKPDPPKEQ
jgi:hypothetical protein